MTGNFQGVQFFADRQLFPFQSCLFCWFKFHGKSIIHEIVKIGSPKNFPLYGISVHSETLLKLHCLDLQIIVEISSDLSVQMVILFDTQICINFPQDGMRYALISCQVHLIDSVTL